MTSVTPVTANQIDIVWGAVTDNVSVGGYEVYRDSLFIATTTLITYSDTGLNASTTYSYTLRAFDVSKNYSAVSGALATTTLPAPVVATTTPTTTVTTQSSGSESSRTAPKLLDLRIDTTTRSADIHWETSQLAKFSFRYGRTVSYELGFVANDLAQ
jgi:chitodextrinase